MRKIIEKVLCWGSVLFGLVLLGSCGTALNRGDWTSTDGLVVGLTGALIAVPAVLFFLGWVYAYFVLRRDLRRVQAQLDELRKGLPPPQSKA